MLRITRHRAGKAVLFQQYAWCVEVLFEWLLIQLSNAKQSKAKQRKGKENKRKLIMTKSASKFRQKSIKIVLKSRPRGGLGSSWGLSLLQAALSWASWGALGSIWHQKPVKKEKNMTFLGDFGASWEPSWCPCGLQEAILAASWASWARFLEPLGRFWEHFLVTCCMGCISKNIEKLLVFEGFLMFWGVGWAT